MSDGLHAAIERLTAWNEGDTDAIPPTYTHDALDFQQDLRRVLKAVAVKTERITQLTAGIDAANRRLVDAVLAREESLVALTEAAGGVEVAAMSTVLGQLRDRGWSVAVHNDYQQGGSTYTFWLLTHPSGRFVKGEGLSDDEAIAECRRKIERHSLEGPPQPFAVQHEDNGTNGWLSLGFNTPEDTKLFWRWFERITPTMTRDQRAAEIAARFPAAGVPEEIVRDLPEYVTGWTYLNHAAMKKLLRWVRSQPTAPAAQREGETP